MKVTIYNSLTDTTNPMYLDVLKVAELIKTGGKQKEFIEQLRTKSKEEYKEGKKSLPIILFGGEFNKRNKEGLIKHSGLITLDFDNVKEMNQLKEKIESKPYVLLNFKSPSNDGYKTIVRIPTVKSDEEYKVFFKALKKDFPELDDSGKDISRATFFSHDPAIYINRYATEYKIQESKTTTAVKDWDKVNKALRKIEDAVDGEKHIVRLKMAHLIGGWVAGKSLTYADALDLLENAVRKNTTDFPAAMKDVRDGLMAGMNKPLSMTEETQVLNMKVGLGKVYYHLDEVWEKIKNIYEQGYGKGLSLGWDIVDEHFTAIFGTTVIAYGQPYSGKSQLWHESYVNLATNYGLNIAMMSPETGEVESIYLELMSIYIGKPFIGNDKMTEQELVRAREFVEKHFYIIDPFGEDFTYRDVLNQVEAIERVYGIKIHVVSVDPLNYLNHIHPEMRADKAQDKDLDLFNASARKHNRLNVIITHARDMETRKEKDRETKETIREWLPLPKPRDILNGQSSYRKGMNMMGFWRPLDLDGEPLPQHEINEVVVDFTKIKPRYLGRVGKFSMYFDVKKSRYYYMQGLQRIYAKGFTPPAENTKPQPTEESVSSRLSHKWDNEDTSAPF